MVEEAAEAEGEGLGFPGWRSRTCGRFVGGEGPGTGVGLVSVVWICGAGFFLVGVEGFVRLRVGILVWHVVLSYEKAMDLSCAGMEMLL